MRALLVEDDALIASGIVAGLRPHGIDVTHVSDGRSAQRAQANDRFDVLLLDLGLPDMDGMALLPRLRAVDADLPVLILTARDALEHRLRGLNGGADDYLVKPFDLAELAARLHALLRRAQGRSSQTISAGPLRLEPASGQAWLDDAAVALSRREIEVLTQLADKRGGWIAADALRERIYGLAAGSDSNALNVHIHNIRRKLGSDAIETARGLGYRLGWPLS